MRSASRTFTFSNVSQLADADAIKTTVASSMSAVSYSGVALNGAAASGGTATPAPNSHSGLAAFPSATSSSTTGAFAPGSVITFTGTYGGEVVTRSVTVTAANGGETLIADAPLETVTRIDVAAQADTDGNWTFGFTGIAPQKGKRFIAIEGLAAANLALGYPGGAVDTIPTGIGRRHECMPSAVLASSTAIFTAYQE